MSNWTPPNLRPIDEGERPFWISYADLMTALMVLFLVVMVISLSQITSQKTTPEIEKVEKPAAPVQRISNESAQRESEIGGVCRELSLHATRANPNILVDCSLNRISFGEVGQFRTGEYVLNSAGQQAVQDLLPAVLDAANSPAGKKWLKQVVIEGFTDTDGSYLYNLNLSLRRSEWVMCNILGHAGLVKQQMNAAQIKQIKQLFLAGGVSFNNLRDSKDASRRVELRLQFYGLGEPPVPNIFLEQKFEEGPTERCHI